MFFRLTQEESCRTCDILREQLEIANRERETLINQIIALTTPKIQPQAPVAMPEPIINKGRRNWETTARMMQEQEKAEAFKIQRDAELEANRIKNLETELGVNDAEQDKVG